MVLEQNGMLLKEDKCKFMIFEPVDLNKRVIKILLGNRNIEEIENTLLPQKNTKSYIP